MNRDQLQAGRLKEISIDDQIDAIFDEALHGVSSFEEIDEIDLGMILRQLPGNFRLEELPEIIENRISLRNAVANGIGRASVDREVA